MVWNIQDTISLLYWYILLEAYQTSPYRRNKHEEDYGLKEQEYGHHPTVTFK